MEIYEPAYVTNFSGAANCTSAVSWSADNKLCAITNEAIRILGSPCSPSEGSYPHQLSKACIDNPDKPFDVASSPYDHLMQDLDIDRRYSLMLDPTLSPDSANASLHRTYHRALWSPVNLGGQRRCLLATLTRDHRIQVWLECVEGHWRCLAEPSAALLEQAKADWAPPPERGRYEAQAIHVARIFDLLKERSYSVATLEITWSHMIEDDDAESYCLLVGVTRSGSVLFWKVPTYVYGESFQVELLKEQRTNIMRVARLCWQQTSTTAGLLVACSDDGSVTAQTVVLRCSEDDKVQLGDPLVLWKSDCIPAQHVLCRQSDGDTYVVCVAKGRFLLCFRVTADTDAGQVQLVLSSFTRDACDSSVTAFDACPTKEHSLQLLVSTMKGDVMNVYVDKNLNFRSEKLNIKLPWMLQPIGLAFSPSSAYFAVFYHIITIVHESVLREPMQLMVFNRTDVTDVCDLLLEMVENSGTASDVQLADAADCLDRIHLYACGKGCLPERLQSYMTNISSLASLDQVSRCGLQLFCFLKRVALALAKSGKPDGDMKRALQALLHRHIATIIKSCDGNCLSDRQKTSVQHFYRHLTTSGGAAKEPVSHLFASEPLTVVVADVVEQGAVFDKCPACGDGVPFTTLSDGTCGQGHRFGRCMNSLLVCEATPPRRCSTCIAFAQREPVWANNTACVYCGKGLV